MKINLSFITLSILILTACGVPDDIGKGMNKAFMELQQMQADQNFKQAISNIELYKLRNGKYPASLDSLEFMNEMDNSFAAYVEYTPMDSVYSLDFVNPMVPGKRNRRVRQVKLHYPDKFWEGLGCVESNAK